MKKIITFLLILATLSTCSACMGQKNEKKDEVTVISTIFPSYDFSRQICGDKAKVSMLLPIGSESHSYEPTPRDIINIQNCDLFIYGGGESDNWIDDILDSMDKKVKVVKMMDCVNAVLEEDIEGIEPSAEKDEEYDEHVWTSPKNAILISSEISKAMCEIDGENNAIYNENLRNYIKKIEQLDESFRTFFDTVENKTIVFGDRFPLRYFADEYGLNYYAAFPGCGDSTEPNAATIAFLINKVKQEDISTIFYIELSNHNIADIIAESTGTKTAVFQTCHNITLNDFNGGETYISLMERNLDALKKSMNTTR